MIARGHTQTKVTAIRMTSEVDAGPIYLKENLHLGGNAEEIYIRASKITCKMIKYIIDKEIEPKDQVGKVTHFKRRVPSQSEIKEGLVSLEEIYDQIRMLDADDYPRAYVNIGNIRIEFSNPILRVGKIEAVVKITKLEE